MTTTNHRPPSPTGNSGRGAVAPFCSGGCGRRTLRLEGPLSFCGACYWLELTLRRESALDVSDLAGLADPEATRARIADVIRRSGVDDAERLVAALGK